MKATHINRRKLDKAFRYLIKVFKGWDIEFDIEKKEDREEVKVRELEQQKNEMLEALIKEWNFIETFLGIEADNILPASYLMFIERQVEIQETIEKADPQHRSWQEIKDLIK